MGDTLSVDSFLLCIVKNLEDTNTIGTNLPLFFDFFGHCNKIREGTREGIREETGLSMFES